MMKITFEVTEIPPVFSETDQKIADLHREATRYKGSDWDKAIGLLQEAAELMRKNNTNHLMQQWLRLPLLLQQAGRFDEAMQEFERLLTEVRPKAERELGAYFDLKHIECRTHLDCSRIYDKMRLACKRQKLNDKAQEYQSLFEHHKLEFEKLRQVIDSKDDEEEIVLDLCQPTKKDSDEIVLDLY